MSDKVKLKKSEIVDLLERGYTKEQIAQKYGLNKHQFIAACRAMGVSHIRPKKVDWEIVPEEENTTESKKETQNVPDTEDHIVDEKFPNDTDSAAKDSEDEF